MSRQAPANLVDGPDRRLPLAVVPEARALDDAGKSAQVSIPSTSCSLRSTANGAHRESFCRKGTSFR
jgi:hypothetical protein